MKNHSKSKRKNQAVRQYFIPMTKNQFQRKSFDQSVNEWVNKKFHFVKIFIESQTTKQQDSETKFKKNCKEIQNEFLLKHKIEGLVSFLPLDYYETLIRYVMQKKLYWTFKMQDSPQVDCQNLHRNMQVQLALALKKYYKNYEYNQRNLHNIVPTKIVDPQAEQQSFNPNKTSVRNSFKKTNPDFLYDLLMMFSVCVVAAFFEHFLPQLQIDKIFRSEIYIIINHSFLDLEVSPSVYDIMEKKLCTNKHQRNFQSLNASQIHEFSNSVHKSVEKNSNNPDSKRTIADEKIKSTATIGNQTLNKFLRSDSKQNEGKNVNSTGFNSCSNDLSTSNDFQNKPFKKPAFKKEHFIKPTTSIGCCLPSDRPQNGNGKNFKNNSNMHPSRFNSFIKDAKQIVIPTMLQEALDNGYLPTNEQIEFYSTIRNCLHVDALPPIKKKKMNIYQYEKLNEVDKIPDIKKQIKAIDQQSKKNHIMSNHISLAMNTFISTSFDFPKKKRVQRNSQIFTDYLKKQNDSENTEIKSGMKSFIGSENKENFELKKLPLKPSTLKFQLTKSCNFYTFDDKVLKIGEISQKQGGPLKTGTNIPSLSSRKLNEGQTSERTDRFQERFKKSSTEVIKLNQTLKSNSLKNEIMSLRQGDKRVEKKKQVDKRKYSRERLSELHSIGSNFDLKSITSFKHIESTNMIHGLKKRVSKNKIIEDTQKAIQQRQSIMNNFQLSSKMQKYQLGTKQVTQIELINQNTNRREDSMRYGTLEGKVNVQREMLTNYKSMYKSFELKKKLKDFEATCKRREDVTNYSVFDIRTAKDPLVYGVKVVKEEDDEESKRRPSECMA